MADQEPRGTLASKVAELDQDGVMELVVRRLQDGYDPLTIIQECEQGLRLIGESYERHVYFLMGLVMAGEIFQQVIELAQPYLQKAPAKATCGRVLLGTVQGDIHDIGKNLTGLVLGCYGFEVEDLGVDVPPGTFLERVEAAPPDIIGLSSLLTTSFDALRQAVGALRTEASPERRSIPIIIGGGLVNEQVCRYAGADYWSTNAFEGVHLCRRIMQKAGAAQ